MKVNKSPKQQNNLKRRMNHEKEERKTIKNPFGGGSSDIMNQKDH